MTVEELLAQRLDAARQVLQPVYDVYAPVRDSVLRLPFIETDRWNIKVQRLPHWRWGFRSPEGTLWSMMVKTRCFGHYSEWWSFWWSGLDGHPSLTWPESIGKWGLRLSANQEYPPEDHDILAKNIAQLKSFYLGLFGKDMVVIPYGGYSRGLGEQPVLMVWGDGQDPDAVYKPEPPPRVLEGWDLIDFLCNKS